jgi:DNA mismatch repair protein MLH3
MFNDPLSLDQCQRLVLQLSRAVFPFQCAHGRPSIAPLLCVDGLGENGRATNERSRASARNVNWTTFQSTISGVQSTR